MKSAIENTLPETNVRGCLFHYGQCIWRKVAELGLKELYSSDSDFERLVRRICGFPFLPLEKIDEAWLELFETAPTENSQVTAFLDYFTNTWLDDENCRFDRRLWNHSNNVNKRTNNNVEGKIPSNAIGSARVK